MIPRDLHFHTVIGMTKSRLDTFQKVLTNSKMKKISIQITIEPLELENENPEFTGAVRELLLDFFSRIRNSSIGPVM